VNVGRVGVVAGVAILLTAAADAIATAAAGQLARPPSSVVQFGYIRSLAGQGGAYRMRFDPALWLSGATANRAAVEDGAIRPGETVPNDYYIRNESRRQLTYAVPANARVTIVTVGAGPRSTRVSVAELAAIVKSRNPRKRKLYGPSLGYWARIVGDRVTRLDQQYQP
jgi:hypothetical protein